MSTSSIRSAPRRQTERLHVGRHSATAAVYFVTFVTARRIPWLATPKATQALLESLRAWHDEGDGAALATTVMPDHVHVLFSLGSRLNVGRCVSRWKTVGQRLSDYGGNWQRDFWEHRLRAEESWEDYGLYMFLNPYRAGLVTQGGPWPGWWVPEPRRFQFTGLLEPSGGPPPEWMSWPEDRFEKLATGE